MDEMEKTIAAKIIKNQEFATKDHAQCGENGANGPFVPSHVEVERKHVFDHATMVTGEVLVAKEATMKQECAMNSHAHTGQSGQNGLNAAPHAVVV